LKTFKINHNNHRINNKNNIVILIGLLHINGFINNDSIKNLYKRHREGKLLRNVNTYRSRITGRWYNDESIFEVFSDVLDDKINLKSAKDRLNFERNNKLRALDGRELKSFKTYLTIDETLKYLNLYLNKNKNFCIDHLYFEYIKPNIDGFEYNPTELNKMFDFDFESILPTHTRSSYDYCCEYCCGDYSDFIKYQSQRDHKEDQRYLKKEIGTFLNTKRDRFKDYVKEG